MICLLQRWASTLGAAVPAFLVDTTVAKVGLAVSQRVFLLPLTIFV